MHLLHLTLQPPTAILHAVYGNFTQKNSQEIVISRGESLELLSPDDQGKLQSIAHMHTSSVIRSISSFRLGGGTKDYIVIGSDSGKIAILEASPPQFKSIHLETFGKTGCRRITPGQFLAIDPKGRAIMIGAIEKQKLVYVMNRDASNRITISSPLEAHRSNTIHYDLIGLDNGFENPLFASLEQDYSADKPEKTLVFYELDLGLNHVTRRWASSVIQTAHKLIPIPGGLEGPGGLLVCAFDEVFYMNEDHAEVSCIVPKRKDLMYDALNDTDVMVISYTCHKQKDLFFVLIQTDLGDLFKISLDYDENLVKNIQIHYFDTIPLSNALCITRTGFLFAASESANHALYQFQGLGEDRTTQETFFTVESELRNLIQTDEMESLAPILDLQVADFANEQTSQMYTLCGRGNRSTLRVLRHGLAVTEQAVSDLPGQPLAVWCIKERYTDEFDTFLVVSFSTLTLVLKIGDNVEEVHDTGLLTETPTLYISTLEDDSTVQIYANGVRHIKRDNQPTSEWKPPGKKVIDKCVANSRQVVVSLAGGELIYFELEEGTLVEKISTELQIEISCLELGLVREGRQRFPYLAVAGWDNTVRILSLDPADRMRQKATQALDATAESLCIQDGYLNIGLHNGVFQRTEMDHVTGQLSHATSRFIGTKSVKLFRLLSGVIALSSRSWYSYTYQSGYRLAPLSYEMLTSASSFTSEQCVNGIVAVTGHSLRILTLDQLGQQFNQQVIPFDLTPRKMIRYNSDLICIESDATAKNCPVSAQALAQVRLFDPISCQTKTILKFELHETAVSCTTCVFHDRGGETFILIGIVKHHGLHTGSFEEASIRVYRLMQTSQFVLVHSTPVDGIPWAMHGFQGKVLISVGSVLRLYDMGKRKLLRKCENKNIPSIVTRISSAGSRIFVGDLHESFHVLKYKTQDNQLVLFADDTVPRYISAQVLLDYDTIAGGDKFGNIFVCRLPSEVSDEVDNPMGNRILWDSGVLNGAPNKLEQLAQFHVGSVVTSMARSTLVLGGVEGLLYSTVLGSIGACIPLSSKEDIDFYTHLESQMRQEYPSVTGRDHLMYRSYFIPVKSVTDGDLCDEFLTLPLDKQKAIAVEMNRSVLEISKKIQDIRNRLL